MGEGCMKILFNICKFSAKKISKSKVSNKQHEIPLNMKYKKINVFFFYG